MSATHYPQAQFSAPAGATDLLLVRHGESAPAEADRPFDLVDGQGDPDLAPAGHRQAELVADRLTTAHPNHLYVTSLRRTAQTADPLATRLALTPDVEPGLREVHLGDWEGGLYRRKVAEQDPLVLRMRAEQRWDVIPGAEPAEQLSERITAAVQRIAGRHPDERVVVFTHGGIIGQLFALASGARPMAFTGADNGSISQLVVSGETWIPRRFNDVAHLTAR